MDCVFGIDIGGTNIKIGKFYHDQIVAKTQIKTNKKDKGIYIFNDIAAVIADMMGDDHLVGLGLGVPGPVVDGIVLGAQNLGWGRFNAEAELQKYFPDVVIRVLNDANAAAVGEWAYGGGAGFRSFIFMTLGTGIGGGLIINNELIEGASGSTGEIGHIRVGYHNDRLCTCGLYDCIEQYASATGIVITANRLRIDRETILNEVEVTSKNVFDYAQTGDLVSLEVVNNMVEKMASALAAITNTINPEAIVIGGGVSKAGHFLLDRLEKRFKELAFFSVRDTKFALAQMGNDAGMYGCSYEVRKKICKLEDSVQN
ncbi:MAG: ROK family protein [Bacilli bacterium]|nr:ROK family protein [Bacilli bacterium]MDD4388558.1 ROK family protein [Bacilli bacterium]